MEEVLGSMTGTSQAVKSRNQMRDSIKALFPDRDCFSLVRPCLEESQLANMDKISMDKLRPEFRQVRFVCWIRVRLIGPFLPLELTKSLSFHHLRCALPFSSCA